MANESATYQGGRYHPGRAWRAPLPKCRSSGSPSETKLRDSGEDGARIREGITDPYRTHTLASKQPKQKLAIQLEICTRTFDRGLK